MAGKRSNNGSERRRSRPATKRHYPRTARLNALLQRIVADHLATLDDSRIGFITVTGVEVDAELNSAVVYISDLGDTAGPIDEEHDAEVLEALGEQRKAIQSDIARSARLRKTPIVTFTFDPAVRTGARIEEILATIHTDDAAEVDD